MADAEYMAHCAHCSTPFRRGARIGRPSKFCSVECKAASLRPKSPTYTHCSHCGAEIESKRAGKMYCSARCALRQRDGTQQTRAEYLAVAKQAAIERSPNYFTCVHCGVLAYRKMGGTNARKGYENKYCSMACRAAVAAKVRAEIDFLHRLQRGAAPPKRARQSKIRAIARMLARVALFRDRALSPCLCCGQPVGWSFGRSKRYCSRDCAGKMPHAVAAKKASKAKRKALQRGASGADSINPIAVFMAAGWKCQLCGKPTPQRLRGTTHKRAPELDHVKPLSKGGRHTLDNVQCLCRECNGWKSDRVVVGQIGLFTSLL